MRKCLVLGAWCLVAGCHMGAKEAAYDVVIYGSSPAALTAAFGGLALQFYKDVADYYKDEANWKWQKRKGAVSHQFHPGVDPYVVKGDPKSGLLPCVEPDVAEPDGSGDRRVQAYCFRMCLTDVPENRIPFKKPVFFALGRRAGDRRRVRGSGPALRAAEGAASRRRAGPRMEGELI